jgi:hypothetical protein
MWYDWQKAPQVAFTELESLCPPGEYRVISPDIMPVGILSSGLLAKTHSILVMSSGVSNGRIYFMFNSNRIDRTDIDQMPYGIAFDGMETIPSGVLIQHGSYDKGRTAPIPSDFYSYITASGLYPLSEMPSSSSGFISDLKIKSQEEAFKTLVNAIYVNFPDE